MKNLLLFFFFSLTIGLLQAQGPVQDHTEYQETPELINNLVHTKLDARLDFPKSQLHGKVWITLSPHFYATDSLQLDAKGMDIKNVSIVKGGKNSKLNYNYDGWVLDIDLDRSYTRKEKYTIYIEYTAKPEEVKVQGSAAISDAKGLYFIDPLGTDPDKPTQVWTQGETEATSVWVPTIDKPNQKTTQEIMLTVPAEYVSLSNGKLVGQKKNSDNTRTDHWKMDQPHAPYLFFIGAGDFAVVKDRYKGKEVSYYVDKEYESVARRIFGMTPEMMGFFGKLLGIEYPWAKYAQMTAHDYVSGAMENTTATLHSDIAQQDARQLVDGNIWEDVIAHELFHHWFGDYVTTESWSNLTLNESFANYSEYLWREYKYGKDAADDHHYSDMQGYLMSGSEEKDLVRFHYHNKEDMFDAVSYNKGGRILHMLRNFLGDSAFFISLNRFLDEHKFEAAEAHQLRLIFEEVSGRDLTWFFNQWYFGSGHAKLDINYSYDDANKRAMVIVKQDTAKTFLMPIAIDVYHGKNKVRYNVWVKGAADTFYFASATKPDLVNFDGDKILLGVKKENKTLDEYIHQYHYAGNYIDRREAIDFAARNLDNEKAIELLKSALNDKYHGLRSYAIGKLDLRKENVKGAVEAGLAKIARNDPKTTVRAAAIGKLADYRKPEYTSLFRSSLGDSSYSVAGNALKALATVDSTAAFTEAQKMMADGVKGALGDAAFQLVLQYGDASSAKMIIDAYSKMPLSQAKFEALQPLSNFLVKVKDPVQFKRGVDAIAGLRDAIPEVYRDQIAQYVDGMILGTLARKVSDNREFVEYIESKLSPKKGF